MIVFEIIPFLQTDFKTFLVYVADTHQNRIAAVKSGRAGDDDGVVEIVFKEYVYPLVINTYFSNFKSGDSSWSNSVADDLSGYRGCSTDIIDNLQGHGIKGRIRVGMLHQWAGSYRSITEIPVVTDNRAIRVR